MSRMNGFSVLLLPLVAVLGTACGDDSSTGTGGGGGATSSSASSDTTSTSDASSTSTTASGEQGGGGGGQPTCTASDPPDLPCDDTPDIGQRCTVEGLEGGCPDTTATWECIDFEGGPFWNRSEDTHCYCSVVGDEASCQEMPGCVWADPPAGQCDDEESDGTPVPEPGCYRDGCGNPGFGTFGLVDGGCHIDLCDSFPPD